MSTGPAKTTENEGRWGSGAEAPQPTPPEAPVHKGAADAAEKSIKPSAPGETGTTPGTNWKP